jgi:hypothetical protein
MWRLLRLVNKRKTAVAAVAIVMLFTFTSFARAQSWTDSAEPSADVKTPPPNLAGQWTGAINDEGFGDADLTLNISQVKSQLSGTWVITGHYSGTIAAGSVNGKNGKVIFKLKISKVCAPKVTAVLSDDNTTMTGNYFANTKHCRAAGQLSASLTTPQ